MAVEASPLELTLYSRTYCHLCDDMIAGLQEMQARFNFRVRIVDVDSDDALDALYGEHVPVLAHGARELCRHRLDHTLVTDYLTQIG